MKKHRIKIGIALAILLSLFLLYSYKGISSYVGSKVGWQPLVEWTDGKRGCGKFVIVSENNEYYNFMPAKNVGTIDPILVVDEGMLNIEFADTSPKLKFDQYGVATLRIRQSDAPCLWQKTATWKPDPSL